MEHAATLFSGHIQLLQQFNRHLPEGYRIEMLTPSLREYTPCYALAPLATAAAEALADGFLGRVVRRAAAARARSIRRPPPAPGLHPGRGMRTRLETLAAYPVRLPVARASR
eukprot:2953422-Prymnesium_polylepis.1